MKHLKKLLAIVLCVILVLSVLPMWVSAEETDAITITVNETKTVDILTEGQEILFKFAPEEEGYYSFYSESDMDTFVTLYDKNLETLKTDDEGGEKNNFRIDFKVDAGEEYYLGTKFYYDENIGSFNVTLVEVAPPTDLIIETETEVNAYVGEIVEIYYSVYPEGSISETTVAISDDSILKVDSVEEDFAYVACIKEGVAEVNICTVNDIKKTVTINVTEIPEKEVQSGVNVKLDNSENNGVHHLVFTPEESGEYIYSTVSDEGQFVYIYDSNNTVLTASNGIIRNLSVYLEAGLTYHIRIDTFGEEAEWEAVIGKAVDPEKLEIVYEKEVLYVGDSGYFETRFTPLYSNYQEVVWESSNNSVLSVDEQGYFEVLAEGTVTVFAKTETLTANKTFTVTDGYKLSLNTPAEVNITEDFSIPKFTFTPEESGFYNFYSTGENATEAWLYDDEYTVDEWDEGSYDGNNFYISSYLEEGIKYYLEVDLSTLNKGSFTVFANKMPTPISATVSSLPYKKEYIKGTTEIAYKLDGAKMLVTFDDESTKEVELSSWDYDYDLEFREDGNKGFIIAEFNGISVEFEVELVESPVESITVDSDFSFALIENTGGYFGYDENGEECYFYDYNFPSDFKVTVNFKDTSKKDVKLKDRVCGEYFFVNDNQLTEPWVLGGEYFVTLSLLGVSVDIPVIIEENKITSIEMTSAPTKTEYMFGDVNYGLFTGEAYMVVTELDGLEFTIKYSDGTSEVIAYSKENNTVGNYRIEPSQCYPKAPGVETVEFEFLNETFSFDLNFTENNVKKIEVVKGPDKPAISQYAEYFNPIGMEIKITFADGTSETVKVTEEKLDYKGYYWEEGIKIENGDNDLLIHAPYYSNETLIICGGVSVEYSGFEPLDNAITNIKVTEVLNNSEGMSLELEFEDGSKEAVNVKPFSAFYFENYGSGYLLTDYGILYYEAEDCFTAYGTLIYTKVNICQDTSYVFDNKGDCNGDGKVNTTDLAALKLSLAGSGDIDKAGADLNEDGDINTSDLAALKLILAGV